MFANNSGKSRLTELDAIVDVTMDGFSRRNLGKDFVGAAGFGAEREAGLVLVASGDDVLQDTGFFEFVKNDGEVPVENSALFLTAEDVAKFRSIS